MTRAFKKIRSKLEKGQGIVEYAMMLAFVVLLGVVLVGSGNFADKITAITAALTAAFAKG